MQYSETAVAQGNRDYQVEFARSLIETLGIDEALDVCARNCWAGIGAAVMSERMRGVH